MDQEEKKILKRLDRARDAGKLDEWELNCRRLAEYRASVGRYEDALRAYQMELSVCEKKMDAAATANANRMIGEMYSTLGKFSESLAHGNKYLNFARETKNTIEEQRALATIGRTYFCWATELKSSRCEVQLQEVLKLCRKSYMKSLYICEEELKTIDRRERQEMKARLLFNLGLACEVEEDVPKALEYVTKSIAICKEELLWEDLHRCLMSKAQFLMKQSETSAALSSIDQACEAAKKLPNTVELTVLALNQKGKIFLTMGNFLGAKNVLKKAYKMNTPNAEDKKTVEVSLKRAMLVVELENNLKFIDDKPLEERKDLYEKFGDACCRVKNFKRAIQAYLNMLECAVSLGLREEDLLPCYVSLYQTYKDNQNYEKALEYVEKELEVLKNGNEAARSHLLIAEIKELKKLSHAEISKHLHAALKLTADVPTKVIALKRLIALEGGAGRNCVELEKELKELDYESEEEEELESDQDELPEVNLSDLSDSEDEGVRRCARNTFRVTRNEKGETPLHVAAIKGDIARAKRLLSLGHPVKERDRAGWTPLHEAANHGHADMVRVLLKAGSNVNDPGGKDCGGLTPLHDAASCGHFDVIEVLLKHDASVSVLTDNNETPLDCLKEWRKRVGRLGEDDEDLYERIAKTLQDRLAAVGFQQEPKKTEKRRWASISPPVSPSSKPDSPERVRPVRDYRAAIEALRKRPTPVEHHKPAPKSALIDENNYVQEWLDDDLKQPKKKRRNDFVETYRVPAEQSKSARKTSSLVDEDCYVDEWPDDDLEHVLKKKRNDSFELPSVITLADEPKIQKQSNLFDAGFTADPILDDCPMVDYPSMPSPPLSSSSAAYLTKVRVTVEKVALMIHIESNKQKELTVKWLAEEAAKRFYEVEGRRPLLQLQTVDGAIFSPLDPVCVVIGEDLNGVVKGWRVNSLTDRYRDSIELIPVSLPESPYASYVQGPDQSILQRLAACDATGRLDFENMALTAEELQPVFRIFKQETNIASLNLAGNALCDTGLEALAESLKQCPVQHINLSCNNITHNGLTKFLDTECSSLTTSLKSLDISFNPIGETNFPQLSKFPNLTEFKTDFCEADFL